MRDGCAHVIRHQPVVQKVIFSCRVAENLRITEIMYNPLNPNEEFIELQNIGDELINLNLVSFTNGIDFTFGRIELASGEHIVVVQNQNVFKTRYGTNINIAGEYSGKLNVIKRGTRIGNTELDSKANVSYGRKSLFTWHILPPRRLLC